MLLLFEQMSPYSNPQYINKLGVKVDKDKTQSRKYLVSTYIKVPLQFCGNSEVVNWMEYWISMGILTKKMMAIGFLLEINTLFSYILIEFT